MKERREPGLSPKNHLVLCRNKAFVVGSSTHPLYCPVGFSMWDFVRSSRPDTVFYPFGYISHTYHRVPRTRATSHGVMSSTQGACGGFWGHSWSNRRSSPQDTSHHYHRVHSFPLCFCGKLMTEPCTIGLRRPAVYFDNRMMFYPSWTVYVFPLSRIRSGYGRHCPQNQRAVVPLVFLLSECTLLIHERNKLFVWTCIHQYNEASVIYYRWTSVVLPASNEHARGIYRCVE